MKTDIRNDWDSLSHPQRLEELERKSNDQVCRDYRWIDHTDEEFKKRLTQERDFWTPDNCSRIERRGAPPKKSLFMGAFRDLDRAEALLELIDNSIDAWNERRRKYPRKSAAELDIYIDIAPDLGRLTYEDNAGGVSEDNLDNLVIPGYSETTDLSNTIGSYRTGGKKAVFRLARNARIDTRHWSTAGHVTPTYTVHLHRDWMLDDTDYQYEYSIQKVSKLEPGQTRYIFQLPEEPLGNPWYQNPEPIKAILDQIRLAYSLILIRNPQINIHFNDRAESMKPDEKLFLFSGAHDPASGLDLRPQSETFEMEVDYEGATHTIEIEIILGCRTTVGRPELAGVDFYGNDRLFIHHDKETLRDLIPGSNARNLVRGLVNLRGPNVLIPWDTHKRHLNPDRPIMAILLNHPTIKQVYSSWQSAYQAIGKQPEIKARISTPQDGMVLRGSLRVPHTNRTRIDPERRRRSRKDSPLTLHQPLVPNREAGPKPVKVAIEFSRADARMLFSHYGISGANTKELGDSIKADVLRRAGKPCRGN